MAQDNKETLYVGTHEELAEIIAAVLCRVQVVPPLAGAPPNRNEHLVPVYERPRGGLQSASGAASESTAFMAKTDVYQKQKLTLFDETFYIWVKRT